MSTNSYITSYINLGGAGYQAYGSDAAQDGAMEMSARFILKYFRDQMEANKVRENQIEEMVILEKDSRLIHLFFANDNDATDKHGRTGLFYGVAYASNNSSYADMKRVMARGIARDLIKEMLEINANRSNSPQETSFLIKEVLEEIRTKLDDVWSSGKSRLEKPQPHLKQKENTDKSKVQVQVNIVNLSLITIIFLLFINTLVLGLSYWHLLKKLMP